MSFHALANVINQLGNRYVETKRQDQLHDQARDERAADLADARAYEHDRRQEINAEQLTQMSQEGKIRLQQALEQNAALSNQERAQKAVALGIDPSGLSPQQLSTAINNETVKLAIATDLQTRQGQLGNREQLAEGTNKVERLENADQIAATRSTLENAYALLDQANKEQAAALALDPENTPQAMALKQVVNNPKADPLQQMQAQQALEQLVKRAAVEQKTAVYAAQGRAENARRIIEGVMPSALKYGVVVQPPSAAAVIAPAGASDPAASPFDSVKPKRAPAPTASGSDSPSNFGGLAGVLARDMPTTGQRASNAMIRALLPGQTTIARWLGGQPFADYTWNTGQNMIDKQTEQINARYPYVPTTAPEAQTAQVPYTGALGRYFN